MSNANDVVDLHLGNRERRSETQDVAVRHRASDQPAVSGGFRHACTDLQLRVEALLGRRVSNEFNRCHEADTANLTYDRRIAERILQCRLEISADVCGISGEVLTLDDVEDCIRSGNANRMA